MKVFEGNILTVNKSNDVARFLVEDGGRIVFVGKELPEKFSAVDRIKLGNKALIPSFCDTHQHFASFSQFHAGLNVMECSTNKEILEGIREFKGRCKEKIMITFGASPYSVEEKSTSLRANLSKARCFPGFFRKKKPDCVSQCETVLS